jgi:long-chain acyl-CoA synthetase
MTSIAFPSVVHMLADTAARVPSREALLVGAERLTYADLLACSAGFARELASLGPGGSVRGERIAILLPNSVEICIATWAAHAAGAQVVPLNPLYTERELEAILVDAAPAVLLYDAARADLLAPLARRLGIAQAVAIAVGAGRLSGWKAGAATLPEPLPGPDDLAFVQYTGGTTGRSKGVNLSHGAVAVNVWQREQMLPTGREGERILCVMPLFHTYALSMGLHLAANCGGTLVVLPRYHPKDTLRSIGAEGITILPGSPTIFNGLMAHEDFATTDFSRVHTCYSGSAPLPGDTLARWEAATGCAILEGYGQTEAGPVLTYNPAQGVRKPGTVGTVLPGTEVQIVDVETGTRVLGVGERGEIRARGPQLMRGYRNLPDETAAALRDGWLHTGDIGELDADGYLTIRDRKKDMVIVGGYNVYPREVEEVLALHPAVQEAAAVGAPDAYRGEVVRAFVTLRAGSAAGVDELLAHCARNLAKYKVPVAITVLEALPKTTVNKTDKTVLRALVRSPAASSG